MMTVLHAQAILMISCIACITAYTECTAFAQYPQGYLHSLRPGYVHGSFIFEYGSQKSHIIAKIPKKKDKKCYFFVVYSYFSHYS